MKLGLTQIEKNGREVYDGVMKKRKQKLPHHLVVAKELVRTSSSAIATTSKACSNADGGRRVEKFMVV